jgi:hypothetical protein
VADREPWSLDTSTPVVTVALHDGENVLAESTTIGPTSSGWHGSWHEMTATMVCQWGWWGTR